VVVITGCPELVTNGYSYTFHKVMSVWMRIADDYHAKSEYSSSFATSTELLSILQNRAFLRPLPLHSLTDNQGSSLDTAAHLENLVASALILKSSSEYKYWLRTYIRYLTTDASNMPKLREICTFLLGPLYKATSEIDDSDSGWQSTVLGMKKRELLKELLRIMSANRGLQRLISEYKESLDSIEEKLNTNNTGIVDDIL